MELTAENVKIANMSFVPALILHSKIKEEEDTSNVIDLDLDKSPEDLVYEWDSKVRRKFKNYVAVDSEQSLDTLMKWYIQTIKEEAINFEDFHALKLSAAKHLQFIKLYFVELNCCFMDNYLDNMEEILSFYINVEIKSLPVKQKDGNKRAYKKLISSICRKIITMLNLYLLKKEDRMCHVVMKVKLNLQSEESKDLLNLLYGNFLTKEPLDKSDLEFCRAYILYQKWKEIRKPVDWEKMDEVMYNLHERTPDSIKENPVLKQILLPQNNSILDTLIHITEKHIIICEEYFKYIKSTKVQEDRVISSSEINNIEIQDDVIISNIEDAEEQEFEKAYKNFVKSMSSVYLDDKTADKSVVIKTEAVSDDEDCQIVEVSSLGCDTESADIIHEILDDDDDDIEIIYFKKKDEKQNTSNEDKKESATLSFLESIKIPDYTDILMDTVSSSTNCGSTSLVDKANNLVETSSSNATVEFADSLTYNSFGQRPSAKESKANMITSVAQTELMSEFVSLESELCKSVANTKNDSNCVFYKTKSTSNEVEPAESVDGLSKSDSGLIQTKTVVSIETQTEEWHISDKHHDKLPSVEKHAEHNTICNSYYYYGLVTPPSDQPHDEHIPPATESATCANVYANIVRTRSPQETDTTLAKAPETDYLPSSIDDNDMDNITKSPPTRSVNLASSSVAQNNSNDSNECSSDGLSELNPRLLDSAFIPDVEPNTKKKHKPLNKVPDRDNCSDECGVGSRIFSNADENIVFNNQGNTTDDRELNVTTGEGSSMLVNEDRSIPPEHSMGHHNSSLPRKTNVCHSSANTYSSKRVNLCSNSLYKCRDNNNIPETSTNNIPCTSADFVTSQDFTYVSNNLFSDQSKPTDVSCTSPDVTSTSTDVQDFSEGLCNGEVTPEDNQSIYHHMSNNVSETENHYINNENYCSDEYVEYSECSGSGETRNNENVTQSNLEDAEEEEIFIEDSVLVNNEEELTYIVSEALPIGADINITMEESSAHSYVAIPIRHENHHGCTEVEKEQKEKHNDSVSPVKELQVTVEKTNLNSREGMNIKNGANNPSKIMFTSDNKIVKPSMDDFSKFQETFHLRWNQLKETHDLDEIFSGPVSKISGTKDCVNPDTSFDLFSSKSSPVCGTSGTLITISPSTQNASEVTSPAYEKMDDFRTYYEQNMIEVPPIRNKVIVNEKIESARPIYPEKNGTLRSVNNSKVTGQLVPKTLESLQDIGQSLNLHKLSKSIDSVSTVGDGERTKTKKVKKLSIVENIIDMRNSVPQLPTNTHNVLKGILKKPFSDTNAVQRTKRVTRPRIPRRMMNLKSLAQYNVKPNDPCIQGVPCVVVERLSNSEISRWSRVSEISMKIRLEKQQVQYATSQSIVRVDYDKQTSHISKNDVVRYDSLGGIVTMSVPEAFGKWRSNSISQTKSARPDEGLQDLPYTEKKTGKRKRQTSLTTNNTQSSKRGPVFRKTSDKDLENIGVRKTNRKRKKPDKDYEALTKSGY